MWRVGYLSAPVQLDLFETANLQGMNHAKKPSGLFARMEVKVAAFTVLQYINLLNHKPIVQVKYALF